MRTPGQSAVAYRVYGLTLRVNRPLPGLHAAMPDGPADVVLDVRAGPDADALPTERIDWIERPVGGGEAQAFQRVWSGAGADGAFLRLR